MKRIIILLTAIFLLSAALPPLTVYAAAYEDAVDFQITLNADGSADFTETHTVAFLDGQDFTRYGRIYIYPSERAMDGWFVTVDGEEWERLDRPDNDERPDGSFAIEYNDAGAVVTMYHRSKNLRRTFSISYHVENAVNLYDDAAEFFWNLTSSNEISTVNELTARVTVPGGLEMREEDFRIWAHGPLNGVFHRKGSNTASLSVSDVPNSNPVDIRIIMPPELFTGGKVVRENVLDDILGQEQELADRANTERAEYEELQRRWAEEAQIYEQWRNDHPIRAWLGDLAYDIFHFAGEDFSGILLIIFIFGAFPFALILAYIDTRKTRKKNERMRLKPAVSPDYYRSLPDRRPPALAGWLAGFYGGKRAGNQFTATLMDMTLKGHLEMRREGRDILLIPKESGGPILAHEQIILDMVDTARGETPSVTIRSFQSYIRRHAEWAVNKRDLFAASLDEQLGQQIETKLTGHGKRTKKAKAIFLLISSLVGFFIIGILLNGIDFGRLNPLASMLIGLVIGFVWGAIILFVTGGNRIFSQLPQKDEDSLALWQAFGRFIDDFTTFDEKELPDISVWKEYLVYAVALGKGEKLIRKLALHYPHLQHIEDGTYYSCMLINGQFDDKVFT